MTIFQTCDFPQTIFEIPGFLWTKCGSCFVGESASRCDGERVLAR